VEAIEKLLRKRFGDIAIAAMQKPQRTIQNLNTESHKIFLYSIKKRLVWCRCFPSVFVPMASIGAATPLLWQDSGSQT
jgi:hypothetical protein